ncbi:MAG: hypothetical protein KKF30_05325 [Proteobacteria bacterium]|nr:hypothetical protein [Pseudomonadota bacterium]MBU4472329.1 hypothetical protein [Pseudomonadota bacterium]MCG2752025.1 DUF5666 domain-containing protein [Desulfobacteraceae bacterium]
MKPFKIRSHFTFLFILFLLQGLLSCNPGGDQYAGGGIGGTGVISTGTVTEIGSVWVNGIEFDTREANIYANGTLKGRGDGAVASSIRPGQVVRVNGSLSGDGSGHAEAVYYFSILSGPIREINQVGKYDFILNILGQDVIANEETQLQGATLELLEPGNLMDISGFIDDQGNIQASFMEKKADAPNPDDRLFISGVIGDLNENNKTFMINTFPVHYENTSLGGPLQEGLENGMWIQGSGQLESDGEAFLAETLNPLDRLENDQGNQVAIEGVIRTDLLENRFFVEGYAIEVNSETLFENGEREEILAGSRIEAEGRFSGGVLVAARIKFIFGFKFQAEIIEIDPVNQTLKLEGLEEVSLEINSLTRFRGQAKSFEELGVGDQVMIRGRFVEENTLVAAQIVKKP